MTSPDSVQATHPEDLAKLHCLRALFLQTAALDPSVIGHIKSAIDYSLTGSLETPAPLQQFAEAALELFAKQEQQPSSYGLSQFDLRGRSWDPLWIQQELLEHLKRLAGYREALLVVIGLRQALGGPGKYWTERLRREHADAVAYIDQLALRWSTPHSRLTLLYV